MYSTAEDIYKSVDTNEAVLKTEVLLQLFSLYIVESRNDLASKVVKEAVEFQPDYPNVTEIARAFFEEQKDWNSAVVLAANESIRTESMGWFDVLKTYIQQGLPNRWIRTTFQLSLVRYTHLTRGVSKR